MIYRKSKIPDVCVIELEPKFDERGYFERIYCQDEMKRNGINFNIVQVNQTMSLKKGTIRGPHIQKFPYEEAKIIQCIKGEIFDVVIDFRKDSNTFGKWFGCILNEKENKLLYIPKGFAHGFQALVNGSIIHYPVSQFYHSESVRGVLWNDPYFNIDWPIKKNVTLSKIDSSWPLYPECYPYEK